MISWTNDSNNAQKLTRQWTFTPAEPTAATAPEVEYAVTYSPSERALHFTAYSAETPARGHVDVYDLTGRRLLSAAVAPTVSLQSIAGTVIVSWTVNGHSRSTKLRL